jgi:hypothetical protein
MALTYVKGAPVIRVGAANDTITSHVVIRGYNFSHTAAGSFALSPGVAPTATFAVLMERLTTSELAKTVMFPKGKDLTLDSGFLVTNLTGTLLLYV